MKMRLVNVGKTDIGWVREGLETYSSRLSHYVRFSVCEIPALKNASSLSREQVKAKEGEMILKELKSSETVFLLDEHGKEYRSVEFAGLVRRLAEAGGGKDVAFVTGGAYGFSQAVYDRSDWMVSLSKMTFSHQMVRVVFAEQLYRAFTIIKGEPYHHE